MWRYSLAFDSFDIVQSPIFATTFAKIPCSLQNIAKLFSRAENDVVLRRNTFLGDSVDRFAGILSEMFIGL